MNVTELARKLKVPTKELLEILPEVGFDIGKKAIKINDSEAEKIIRNWRFLLAKFKKQQEEAQDKGPEAKEDESEEKKKIAIPDYISVKDFAIQSGIPVTTVLSQLMKSGTLLSMNEKIDFDTAQIIGEDLGIDVEPKEKTEESTLRQAQGGSEEPEDRANVKPRPPVVVIMGHVDHGKTKLLDTIRKSNVVDKESGGITQHIGAYQIEKKGKLITFIDTPGHEAFTTMRSRGAKVADIAILIVAADDGIMPQTKESIKIIKSGKLPMIVAINKIDKPDASVEKVKQQLAQENLMTEDWGGKIISVPISALTGKGVDELLENILLVADVEKENIVANPDRPAVASIVESHVDKGEGPVATALVQQGTLKQGDLIFFNGVHYGKVRTLKDFLGNAVKEATPSMPVKLLGLKGLPAVGDILEVQESVKKASKAKRYQLETQAASVYTPTQKKVTKKNQDTLNLILRADVLGSLEAIIASINKLSHPDIQVNIIGKGLGNVTENDVILAESNHASILSFHATPTQSAKLLAQEKNIEINKFQVIYQLIDKVKELIESKLKPEVTKTTLGKIEILKVFQKAPKSMVVGGTVISGKAVLGAEVQVLREDIEVGTGKIVELQTNKIAAKEVEKGTECGIKYEGQPVIAEGDILEVFTEEVKEKKLD